MSSVRTVFASALFAGSLLIALCSAPAQYPGTTSIQPSVPAGSFRETCKDSTIDSASQNPTHWKLDAKCKKYDRSVNPTSLIGFESCFYAGNNIWNHDGQLECALPPGPYLSSCPAKGDRMTASGGATPGGNVLVAKCRVGNGPEETLKFSTVEQCPAGIQIGDVIGRPGEHQLFCPVPAGSYLQTCVSAHVRDPWNVYNGASNLWAICTQANGQPRLSELPEPYYCLGVDISNNNGVLTCNSPQPHCAGLYGTCIVLSGSIPPQAGGSQGCSGNPYESCP